MTSQDLKQLPLIVLVGQPNVGKSVIFSLLTGQYVTVSNYPGTTVEVSRGILKLGKSQYQVIDTPGINSITPFSDDERVTRDLLVKEKPAVVLQVGDAKNPRRILLLTVQLLEMGLPVVLALNMVDEARNRRVFIEAAALSRLLGIEVIPTVATRKEGIKELYAALGRAGAQDFKVNYHPRLEQAITELSQILPPAELSPRVRALMLLSGDDSFLAGLSPESAVRVKRLREELEKQLIRPAGYLINDDRLKLVDTLLKESVKVEVKPAGGAGEKLGRLFVHPVLGVWILFFILFLMYQFVGVFCAGKVVNFLENQVFGSRSSTYQLAFSPVSSAGEPLLILSQAESAASGEYFFKIELSHVKEEFYLKVKAFFSPPDSGGEGEGELYPVSREKFLVLPLTPGGRVKKIIPQGKGEYLVIYSVNSALNQQLELSLWSGVLNPFLAKMCYLYLPGLFLKQLLLGKYGLISMALTYALAIIFPIVVGFFIFFGLLEDSGYLPRLAFLSHNLMSKIGLSGKAVLPMVLGLGCGTMAVLTTRILETRRERIIATLLLTLGVPCSAQLGIVLAMLASVSLKALLLWLLVIGGVLILVGFLAAKVLPGEKSCLLLELPPIRLPELGNILIKTYARLKWFLKEAVPFFLMGTLVLFLLDWFGLLALIEKLVSPVVVNLLNLPQESTLAFILGFMRRDYGAAGFFKLAQSRLLNHQQLLVGVVVITLLVPCIAQFLMVIKERGYLAALWMAIISLSFAVLTGALLSRFLSFFAVSL